MRRLLAPWINALGPAGSITRVHMAELLVQAFALDLKARYELQSRESPTCAFSHFPISSGLRARTAR